MSEQIKVKIEMEDGGVMLAELYPDIAPKTVENFLALVDEGVLQRADLPPRDPRAS